MVSTFALFKERYSLDLPNELMMEACTHPSYRLIDPEAKPYEQMETLGDAVLDVLVTSWIISEHPDMQPGDLTTTRSIMVNNQTLSQLGTRVGLTDLIRCADTYTLVPRDISNVVEAVFGALYLWKGMDAAQELFNQIKSDLTYLTKTYRKTTSLYNPISRLQEYCQQEGFPLPSYKLIEREGPDHRPQFRFTVQVETNGKVLSSSGSGSSKKKARADAAKTLLEKMNIGQ